MKLPGAQPGEASLLAASAANILVEIAEQRTLRFRNLQRRRLLRGSAAFRPLTVGVRPLKSILNTPGVRHALQSLKACEPLAHWPTELRSTRPR